MEDPISLDSIKNKCMDSPGYLIFTACLTNKKDKKGQAIIEFKYRRFHFSLEDAKSACLSLQGFVDGDIKEFVDRQKKG